MNIMRLNILFTMTAVATVLVGCQPKDVTITKRGDANVSSNSTGANPIELNKLLSVALERQIEPLYLLKAVLNPQYAQSQGLELTTDVNTQVTTLSAVNGLKKIDTPAFSSEYSVKYEIQALVKDANGNLTLLILKNKATEFIQTVGSIKTGKKDKSGQEILVGASSKAGSEFISIKLTENPGIYSVEVARAEEINSKADKKNSVVSSIVSTIEWDGSLAALDNDVPMKLKALKVDRIGFKNTSLKYDQITTVDPILVKIGSCLSATGSVTLGVKIVDKKADKMTPVKFNNTVVNLKDSSIEINESFLSAAKDCATRPVVDLTRML